MANQTIATYCVVNSVNLSGFLIRGDFPEMTEMLPDTVMTHTAKSNRPGLNDSSISLELVQDYAAGGPDATLSAIKAGRVAVTIEWRPTSASVGSGNPKRSATYVLESYDPMSGMVGELAKCKVTFKPGGASPDVTRVTS